MFQQSNPLKYFPQGLLEMRDDHQMPRPTRALCPGIFCVGEPLHIGNFPGGLSILAIGTWKDRWFFSTGRKAWGPSFPGADERQTSTFESQPDLSGGSLEAKPARSLPCPLGSMMLHSVTMFSLLLQCHSDPLTLWAPQCHSMGPCNATMVSMEPRCPAGSPRPFGCTRPCNAAMASWFHKALLLHTGPLGPWGPAVPQ